MQRQKPEVTRLCRW